MWLVMCAIQSAIQALQAMQKFLRHLFTAYFYF